MISKAYANKSIRTLYKVAVTALVGLHMAMASASDNADKRVTVALNPEPSGLVAAFNTDSNLQMVSAKIHEGLLDYNQDLQPVGVLAESWSVAEDGRTVTFHLRKNVTWHDGKPFTSADVKFTLEKVLSRMNPQGQAIFANLQEVATPDEHTAVVRLSSPAPYMMNGLAGFISPMLPKHIYDDGQEMMRHSALAQPIGTGPFMFEEWQKGSHILLKRNPNYWQDGKPQLGQVVFRVIPDPAVRAVAFERGEVDLGPMWPVPLPEMERLTKGNSNLVAEPRGYALMSGVLYLGFNTRSGPFADVRVRQAVAHAINRAGLAKIAWRGVVTPGVSPISDQLTTFHIQPQEQYPFDVKRAETLLDEAGYKRGAGGIRFKAVYDPLLWDDSYRRSADYVRQALRTVGIDLEVRAQDIGAFIRRIWTDGDFQMYSHGSFNTADPTIGVQRLYWSKAILKGVPFSNGSGYANPEMDKLWEQAQIEVNAEERKQVFAKIQEIGMRDLPYLPLVNLHYQTLRNARVIGLDTSATGMYGSFADLSIR